MKFLHTTQVSISRSWFERRPLAALRQQCEWSTRSCWNNSVSRLSCVSTSVLEGCVVHIFYIYISFLVFVIQQIACKIFCVVLLLKKSNAILSVLKRQFVMVSVCCQVYCAIGKKFWRSDIYSSHREPCVQPVPIIVDVFVLFIGLTRLIFPERFFSHYATIFFQGKSFILI